MLDLEVRVRDVCREEAEHLRNRRVSRNGLNRSDISIRTLKNELPPAGRNRSRSCDGVFLLKEIRGEIECGRRSNGRISNFEFQIEGGAILTDDGDGR